MREPSKFDILAAEVSGTGESEYRGLVHPMMLRLDLSTYAGIAALADMAQDTSRNAVANSLLEAALDEVSSRLDGDTLQAFKELQAQHLGSVLESKQTTTDTLKSGKRAK